MRKIFIALVMVSCLITAQIRAANSPAVALSFLGKTIKVGDKVTLAAATINGTDSGYDWLSSNSSVVRIEGEGVVVGVSAGVANVTATGKTTGAVGSATITVVEISASTSVTITPGEPSLNVGKVLKLTAVTDPFIEENYDWISADSSIASVDSAGYLTAKTAGMTRIYASGQISMKTGSVVASVLAGGNVTVTITPTDRKLKVGEAFQFSAVTKDTGANLSETYLWQAQDPEKLAVLSNGTATGRAAGTTVLSALGAQSGYLGQINVTVEAPSDFFVEKYLPVLAGGGLGLDCFLLLANPTSTGADVEVTATSADGTALGAAITITLGAGKKQILPLENPTYFTSGDWNISVPPGTFYSLKTRTKQAGIISFAAVLFNAAERGDVLIIESRSAMTAPLLAAWKYFESYLAIQNASAANASAHVKFLSDTGGVLLDEVVNVAANGLAFVALNPVIKDRTASWIEVSSGGTLTAQFFFADSAGNWNAFPLDSAAPNSVVLPFMPASANSVAPTFSVINPGDCDITIACDLFNSRGEKLARPANLSLKTKTSLEGTLSQLWPDAKLPDDGFVTASFFSSGAWNLLAASEDSTNKCFRVFRTSGTSALSANALHLSTGGPFDTLMALRNSSASPATVNLILYGDDGVSLTTSAVMLSAGETRYQALSSWFGLESALNGRLRIESNQPVTGAIFGSITNGSRIMQFEMPLY